MNLRDLIVSLLVRSGHDDRQVDVLRGAVRTIATQKPLLIVSRYHNATRFFDLLPFIQSINPDDKFHVRKLDDTRPVYEMTLFCS